jgi:two-component system nitrate/nitrite response regulator NarL
VQTCLILDDHEEVLESVAAYLAVEGFDVVGRATDAAQAIELLRTHQPNLAILDNRLRTSSGLEVARALSVAAPATRAVLFSGGATRGVVEEAFASGVRAVVLKESGPETLLRALQVVLAGRRYVDPSIRRRR